MNGAIRARTWPQLRAVMRDSEQNTRCSKPQQISARNQLSGIERMPSGKAYTCYVVSIRMVRFRRLAL
jgi:hypothetical protein